VKKKKEDRCKRIVNLTSACRNDPGFKSREGGRKKKKTAGKKKEEGTLRSILTQYHRANFRRKEGGKKKKRKNETVRKIQAFRVRYRQPILTEECRG